MRLVKCPDCGRDVSKNATSCPNCGAPRKKGAGPARAAAVVILGTLGVVVMTAVVGQRTSPTTGAPGAVTPKVEMAAPGEAAVELPSNAAIEAAIAESDDFDKYRMEFIEATKQVLRERRCTLEQLKEMGGWVKSTKHRQQPIYFTYCGESHVNNRIYVDVTTGRIFR